MVPNQPEDVVETHRKEHVCMDVVPCTAKRRERNKNCQRENQSCERGSETNCCQIVDRFTKRKICWIQASCVIGPGPDKKNTHTHNIDG